MNNIELLNPGTIIEQRYVIDECIKSDTRGAVYKAHDKALNKICFIKELFNFHLNLRDKRDAKRKFERESKILSELRHKKIPRVTAYFGTDERCYLSMDYVFGYDLNTAFIKEGAFSFPEDKVIKWMIEVCEILDYLHSHYDPVIFKDLKPSNIMVSELDGTVRLVDFGIAHTLETDNSIKNEVRGFNAPEMEEGISDIRSDIYSFGATMYYLLTGVIPVFPHIKSLREVNPDISRQLNNITMKALKIKPDERYQNAKEMYNELLKCAGTSMASESINTLISQLSLPDGELRKSAVQSLGEIDDESIVGPLMNLLTEEEDWTVRKEIVMALKNFKESKDIVIKALCDRFKHEDHPEVKASIAEVLAALKAREGVEVLVTALDDQFANIQLASIIALGNIGDKKALDHLFNLYKNKNFIFREDVKTSIEKIDPNFLKLWEETEEIQQASRNQKITIVLAVCLSICLIIGLLTFKFLPPYIKAQKIAYNMNKGEECFKKNNYKEAVNFFLQVTGIDPSYSKGHYSLGIAYLNLRQNDDALKAFEEAEKLDEKNPDYKVSVGQVQLLKENFNEAITELEKAIKLKKDIPEAYLYLGEAYNKAGKTEKAKENFNYCVNNFPKSNSADEARNQLYALTRPDTDTNTNAGDSDAMKEANSYLYDQGEYDKAIQKFNEILTKNPNDIGALFGRGMSYYNKGDFNNAQDSFNKILTINSFHAPACIALGGIYLKENNYEKTIEITSRGLDQNSNIYEGYYIRGIAYYNTGKRVEALNDFKKYTEMAPPGDKEAAKVKELVKKMEGN